MDFRNYLTLTPASIIEAISHRVEFRLTLLGLIRSERFDTMSVTTPEFLLKGDDTRYDSAGDVHRRLNGTFIKFEGEPVYVVAEGMFLTARKSSGQSFVVSANDKRLDISSLPLGFINTQRGAQYVSRWPRRSQVQGVHPDYMVYHDIQRGASRPLSFSEDVMAAYFRMFQKSYPTIELGIGLESFAFSRQWALVSVSKTRRLLYYKNTAVGWYTVPNKTFVLHRDFSTGGFVDSLQAVLSKQYGVSYNVALA